MTILNQKKFMQGQQAFVLENNDVLQIETKTFGAETRFSVKLSTLDPSTSEYRKNHYSGLAWSVVFFPLSLFLLYEGFNSPPSDAGVLFFLSVIFLILGALGIVLFLKRSYHNIIYYNRYSGQPAVVLFKSKPSDAALTEFTTALSAGIAKAIDVANEESTNSRAREIKELADLMAAGLLTEEEFSASKKAILGLGKSSFGFQQS